MHTVAEYAAKFRAEYPFRYAIAFGELEGALEGGRDMVEQMRRLKAAMDEVEHRQEEDQ